METKYIPDDLVMFAANTYVVTSFEQRFMGSYYELYSVANKKKAFVETRNIVPISLTSIILEKNGWEHIKEVYWKDYPNLKLVISNGVASVINEQCSLYLRQIDYVHQLQHLLWALDLEDDLKI